MSRALRRASQVLGSPTGINCAKEDEDENNKQQHDEGKEKDKDSRESRLSSKGVTKSPPSVVPQVQLPSPSTVAEQKSLKATGSNGEGTKSRGGEIKARDEEQITCHGTQDVAIETNSPPPFGGASGSQLLNSLPLSECTQGANSSEEGQLTVKDIHQSTYHKGDKGKDPAKIVKKDNQVPLLACYSDASDKEEEGEKKKEQKVNKNNSITVPGQAETVPKSIYQQSTSFSKLTTCAGDADALHQSLSSLEDAKQRRHMTFDTKSTGDADEEKFQEEFGEEMLQGKGQGEEANERQVKAKEDAHGKRKKRGGAEEEKYSKDAQVKQDTNEANSSSQKIPSKKFVHKDKDKNENQGQGISKEEEDDDDDDEVKKEEENDEKQTTNKCKFRVERQKHQSQVNVETVELNFNDPLVTKAAVDFGKEDKQTVQVKFDMKLEHKQQHQYQHQQKNSHFDSTSREANKGTDGRDEDEVEEANNSQVQEQEANSTSLIDDCNDQLEEQQSNESVPTSDENELIELLNEHRSQLRLARAVRGGNEGDVYFRFFTQLLRCIITVGFIYFFKQKSKELFLQPPH